MPLLKRLTFNVGWVTTAGMQEVEQRMEQLPRHVVYAVTRRMCRTACNKYCKEFLLYGAVTGGKSIVRVFLLMTDAF